MPDSVDVPSQPFAAALTRALAAAHPAEIDEPLHPVTRLPEKVMSRVRVLT